MVYRYPDGHEETEPTTLVEFPAYAGQLGRSAPAARSLRLRPGAVHVTGMLDEIQLGIAARTRPGRRRVRLAVPGEASRRAAGVAAGRYNP